MACYTCSSRFRLLTVILGLCWSSPLSLAGINVTEDEKESVLCSVQSVHATAFLDNTTSMNPCGFGIEEPEQCGVVLYVTWTQPDCLCSGKIKLRGGCERGLQVYSSLEFLTAILLRLVNLSCVNWYIVKIERLDTTDDSWGSGNGHISPAYNCMENYTALVEANATYLILSSEHDAQLRTHCLYNITVIAQSLDDDVNISVSITKNTAELDHKKPKLRLLRKEWFPLPNGSYHLQAAFFIDNHVGHWITRPQAPVNTCPQDNPHFLKLRWDGGPEFEITMTQEALESTSQRYCVNITIAINTVDRAVRDLLSTEPLKMRLKAPVLPPGPVQNLTVTGVWSDTLVDLHVQWSMPVEPRTTARLEYNVLLTGGGNTSSLANSSFLYHAEDTGLNATVDANGTEWILVSVRGVNAQHGLAGNWTDFNFTVNANGPSTVPWWLHVTGYLLPRILPPVAVAFAILCCVGACLCSWLTCACWRCHRQRQYLKMVRSRIVKEKTLDMPLAIESALSRGNFGHVISTRLLDTKDRERLGLVDDRVAMKVLVAHEDNKSDIQQEIDILCTLKRGDCSNVVKMFDFGWDETGGRVTIVMEHVEYGSLVSYLRWSGAKLEVYIQFKRATDPKDLHCTCDSICTQNHPFDEDVEPPLAYDALGPISEDDQLNFAAQIANGMEYIADHDIIHCDLACRNVLLGKEKLVKIADFGLAQKGRDCTLHQTELPCRWMAPEAIITKRVSTETDVWSYGVTLWEMWSYGIIPLSHLSNEEVIAAVHEQPDCALQQPLNCKADVWSVIIECWNITPENRPYFSELAAMMDEIKSQRIDAEC